MEISLNECIFSNNSLNLPALSLKSMRFELFGTGKMFGTGKTTVRVRGDMISRMYGFKSSQSTDSMSAY